MGVKLDMAVRRIFAPSTWSVGLRRIFLLTFPVAIAVWAICAVGAGVVFLVGMIWEPIDTFWNAPPKRMSTNGYYIYGQRSKQPRNLVDIDVARQERDAA